MRPDPCADDRAGPQRHFGHENMSNVTSKRAIRDTIVMVLIMALLFGGGYWLAEHIAW